jgi:hypothetical protein
MIDPKDFLGRWSRRKRAAAEQPKIPESPERKEESESKTPTQGKAKSLDSPTSQSGSSPAPEFDISSLPSIESIGANTDVSQFMQKGVPTALRHAALRRAWSADPAIRDFIGPTENYWDAAGPDGVPGFGDLDPELDVKRLIAEIFGETETQVAKSESAGSAPNSDVPEQAPAAPTSTSQRPTQLTQNAAPQYPSGGKKIPRRHGGAMPE